MTKEYVLIRSILGPVRSEAESLAWAVREAERLMFDNGTSMDDIRVTKDIYPFVARHLGKSYKATARQIERLNNFCWDSMDEAQKIKYIGRSNAQIRAPRDMIFFLAFYCYYEKPYYKVLEEYPSILFGASKGVMPKSRL